MKLLRRILRGKLILAIWPAALLGCFASAEILPPGFRPAPLGVHALVGGKVMVKPGESLDAATIIIRDGLIQAVGTNVAVPEDARVWNMNGKTIYAGFIEPYFVADATNPPITTSDSMPITRRTLASGGFKFYGAPGVKTDEGKPGPGYPLSRITPDYRAVKTFSPNEKNLGPLRELGFTAAVIVPSHGIIRGTSALVQLGDDDPNDLILQPNLFQHIAFETSDNDDSAYPSSLMGVIAAVRQTFFDAQHYALERADFAQHPQNRKRPEFDPSLEALAPSANHQMRVLFEPGSVLMDDRAAQVSRELGLDFAIVACGQEWRRLDLVAQASRLFETITNRMGGTPVPLTFIVPVNFPSLPKLPNEEDWDQISLDQLRAWDWAAENPALLRKQNVEIALTTYGLSDKKDFPKNLRLALDRGLSEDDALAALTTIPARLCRAEKQLGTIEAGKLANLVVVQGGSYFDADAKVRAVWVDGKIYPAPVEEPKPEKPEAQPEEIKLKEEPEKHPKPPEIVAKEEGAKQPETNQTAKVIEPQKFAGGTPAVPVKTNELREVQKTRVARSPIEDRGAITNPPAILVRNATIWTCGPLGILTNAQVLFRDGKVVGLGEFKPEVATSAFVIDADGMSVTPGIIDCHSHTAILGNVNEIGLPSTAMVRISDVVNSETANIRQQLAGGVTCVNLLHGSANPIGGQNCVIKLREGGSPEDLIFSNAPPGIKFALGENVKQSNWGEHFTSRFPQTRMGVRTFYENRFTAAQEYLAKWQKYRISGGLPPQRDLELEAIGEIIQGKRWIHCHAYRQDEMLMLTRVMQRFRVQIGTFQHGLEAYKIADELAAANIGVSTFSDWWAYKFEVYDAIPFNGTLLNDRGVVVSFNSDSSELSRRLYLEAAKAVKYGGTPEEDALKFVTLNPAKQLRIDRFVGSLEPGKDADFVIWSKSPLDSQTVCLQTWIEGKKYFDRAIEAERNSRLKKEREDLIAKAKRVAKLTGGGSDASSDDEKSFFKLSLEHEFDGRDRHCLDEIGGEE